ncbi:hypothetical protein ACFL4T_14530 [candidate division KSB1 bacterium]
MKIRISLSFLVMFFLLMYCSETTQDSGINTPTVYEPYIIEAVLCLEVVDGLPAGITNIFTTNDEIHIWIEWDNIYDRNTVSVNWIKPNGSIEADDSVTFTARDGRKVTWFALDPGDFIDKGFWEIEILLNGHFQRSYLFELI